MQHSRAGRLFSLLVFCVAGVSEPAWEFGHALHHVHQAGDAHQAGEPVVRADAVAAVHASDHGHDHGHPVFQPSARPSVEVSVALAVLPSAMPSLFEAHASVRLRRDGTAPARAGPAEYRNVQPRAPPLS